MATSKVDVYAHGILVLELLTGKLPVDDCNGDPRSDDASHLVAWVKAQVQLNPGSTSVIAVLDPRLIRDAMDDDAMRQMLRLHEVGPMCTHKQPAARPSMHGVETMLDIGRMTPSDDPSITTAAKGTAATTASTRTAMRTILEARRAGVEQRTRPRTLCDQLTILSSSHHTGHPGGRVGISCQTFV